MKKIFVTSDTHFNHNNIIKYCNRPFKNVNEMNEELIKRWNEVVGVDDTVYHLGDFGFGTFDNLCEIFDKLNGNKILIMGNHDYRVGINFYKEMGFVKVYKKETILDNCIFTHYPKNVDDGFINLFGHIHDKEIPDEFNDGKHICVCVDKTNFYPVELSELLKGKCKYGNKLLCDSKETYNSKTSSYR